MLLGQPATYLSGEQTMADRFPKQLSCGGARWEHLLSTASCDSVRSRSVWCKVNERKPPWSARSVCWL